MALKPSHSGNASLGIKIADSSKLCLPVRSVPDEPGVYIWTHKEDALCIRVGLFLWG